MNTQHKKKVRFPRWILISGSVVLITLAVNGMFLLLNTPPIADNLSHRPITIVPGESFSQVANKLSRHNIIRSALWFRTIGKITDQEHAIQSGTFNIPVALNSYQVLSYITHSNQVLERLTIPEGYTIRRIGQLLEHYGITTLEEFRKATSNPDILTQYDIPADNAEGYLYPDTYLLPRNYDANHIVEQMIQRFYTELEEVYPNYHSLNAEILYNKIIVASMVEREYVDPEEAALISSVFHNRLQIGMPLQSCATVVYVLTEELLLPHPQQLFYQDLERPSDYNTYLHNSLPPTPIANPGATALRAAFWPADSDYIYFVLKGSESTNHHFSRTIEEHSQATIFYLRGH